MIFNYTDATASNYLMPLNMGGEYNGDLFMILTEENGGLVKNKPLNIQPDSDASINRINRVEFQLKDGMKIIYAAYLGEPSDDSSKILTANYTVQYVHRKLPIQSPASRTLIHQTGIPRRHIAAATIYIRAMCHMSRYSKSRSSTAKTKLLISRRI